MLHKVLRFLNRASWYAYVIRTNKMHTFFINDLIQLQCLWHVSNNQVFILRKTCTCSFKVFYHAEIIITFYELSRYTICKSAYRWFFLHVTQNRSMPKTGYVIYHQNLQHAAATTFLIIKIFYSPTEAQVNCLKKHYQNLH